MKDCYEKYLIPFILLLLISLSWKLYGRIVIVDCDGKILIPEQSAVAKIHKSKAEKVIEKINSNNCLSKLWKDLINSSNNNNQIPISINLNCDPNYKLCGEASVQDHSITIPKYYNNWQSSCGCEEATILHELLHACAQVPNTDDDDKKIRGCEVKCTSEITRCKKYPPSGQACDCPK